MFLLSPTNPLWDKGSNSINTTNMLQENQDTVELNENGKYRIQNTSSNSSKRQTNRSDCPTTTKRVNRKMNHLFSYSLCMCLSSFGTSSSIEKLEVSHTLPTISSIRKTNKHKQNSNSRSDYWIEHKQCTQ